MNSRRREEIRQTLRRLAAAQATAMELMEHTLSLLRDELALDPISFWEERQRGRTDGFPQIDWDRLSVTFEGRTCFLGNTLPFHFLTRLAQQPNVFISYEELLNQVWSARRSDAAVRSVAKTLRAKLRVAGMHGLADSIDGTVKGHYRLHLGP